MSRAERIGLTAGVFFAVGLVVHAGVGTIAHLVTHAGGVLLWLVPLQILPMTLDACGWECLISGRVRLLTLFEIACTRQAINRLLPVANVGGDIIGIRLLSNKGVDRVTATASVLIELMLGLVAQYLFVIVGIGILLSLTGDAQSTRALILGLALSLPPMILVGIVIRKGRVFVRMAGLGRRLLGRWLNDGEVLNGGDRLEFAIQEILGSGSRPLRSVAWQLGGFLAGCSETWLALRWLGTPIDIAQAVVLESLTQGARSLFFLIPTGLGVQEAGLVGFGHLLGLSSDAALALSLAKRMREVLFGVPVLVWQWVRTRGTILR